LNTGGNALDVPQHVLSKRLRVFSTVVATLTYCVRNAGHLFVLAWFPCALDSACRIGLEWLIYDFPPRLPQWLQFSFFVPATWLTPIVAAPLVAMVWAFVLSDICDRNPDRGTITVLNVRHDWIRFELSPVVLLGAGFLLVTDVGYGLLWFVNFKLLLAVHPLFEGRDALVDAWARWTPALPLLVLSVVSAWTYPAAAQILRAGVLDRARVRSLMRGNRLRLTAIFLILNVAFYQFDVFVRPATGWIVHSLVDQWPWTLREATIRHVLEFPLDILWIVPWAVAMGIVMNALASPSPSAELDHRATRAA
jgi:hypothetical protein